MTLDKKERLAVFLATSGHSGVDRVMKNLLPAIAERGVLVDLLHVRNHGPNIGHGNNLRIVELGTSHAYSSLLPLANYLRRVRPDALLSDKDRVNRVALIAKILSGASTRIIVRTGTTVSLDLASRHPFDRLLTGLSMKFLYRKADRILLPSEAAREDFLQVTGLGRDKVLSVPSPVATPELYRLAERPENHPWLVEKSVPVIVGIGELSGRKDFTTLIRAFGMVRTRCPARLIILGDGKDRSTLEIMVRDLGLSADVYLPGFKDNPYSFLARADLYVHSARQEGSPVALMEAVALGVPCVSTDCPSGPAEILQKGRIGKLVPVGDTERMAEAMECFLHSPPDRDHIKEGADPFTLEHGTLAYMKAIGLGNGE